MMCNLGLLSPWIENTFFGWNQIIFIVIKEQGNRWCFQKGNESLAGQKYVELLTHDCNLFHMIGATLNSYNTLPMHYLLKWILLAKGYSISQQEGLGKTQSNQACNQSPSSSQCHASRPQDWLINACMEVSFREEGYELTLNGHHQEGQVYHTHNNRSRNQFDISPINM